MNRTWRAAAEYLHRVLGTLAVLILAPREWREAYRHAP